MSEINKIKGKYPELKNEKFNLTVFVRHVFNNVNLMKFHGNSYKRVVFYFVKNDKRVSELLELPKFLEPDQVEDVHIQYCGKQIRENKKAAQWLNKNKAPGYVLNSLYKSEKAVDTKICCDVLTLLALNKLDRLFLLTNDYDFLPLCKTIKSLGANINLIRLQKERVNKDLVQECDGFHAFNKEHIYKFFKYSKKAE